MAWYGAGRGSTPILINPPLIVTSTLPGGTPNVAYSQQLSAINGNPPYTFVLVSGADGNGFPTCTTGGLVSGTPLLNETLTLVFQVTDNMGLPSAPKTITLSVGQTQPGPLYPGYIDTNNAMFTWIPPPSQPYWADCGFDGRVDNGTPGVAGTTLTVTAITSLGKNAGVDTFGTIVAGQTLYGGTTSVTQVPGGVTILPFGTNGTTGTGGIGTYALSGSAFTVAQTNHANSSPNLYSNTIQCYSVYQNGVLVCGGSTNTAGLLAAGVTPSPVMPQGQGPPNTFPKPYPWYLATGLSAGTTYNFTVKAITGGVEGPASSPLAITTLQNAVGSTLPTAPADPSTWVQDGSGALNINTFVLPPSAPRFTVTQTASANYNATGGLGWALSQVSNDGLGIVIIPAALGTVNVPTQAGSTPPAYTGNSGWVYVMSDQDPVLTPGGTLIPYANNQNGIVYTTLTLTAAPAAAATTATLAANQAGWTDSSGNWLQKTGWYYVYFTFTTPQGVWTEEERQCSFVKGSSTIRWSTELSTGTALNPLFPTNGVSTVGSIVGGSGYTVSGNANGTAQWVSLSGGTGTNAMADTVTVVGGVITAMTIINNRSFSGSGYTVNDVLTPVVGTGLGGSVLLAGTGASATVTAVGGNGAGLTAACKATAKVAFLPGVTPCSTDQGAMPTIAYATSNGAAFTIASGTKKIRFIGLNMTPQQGITQQPNYTLVNFPTAAPKCDHTYFDRCLMGNDPNGAGYVHIQHGLSGMSGDHCFVSQCYTWGIVAKFDINNGDSNHYGVGGGFHCFQNTYMQCGGESLIYGGTFVSAPPDVAHDIVVRYNMSHKPMSWFQGCPNRLQSGATFLTPWGNFGQTIKDHLELKVGQRAEYYGNLIVNCWNGTIGGYNTAAFAIGARDQTWNSAGTNGAVQTDPWAEVNDAHIHDNCVYYCGTLCYTFTGDPAPSAVTFRQQINNNQLLGSPFGAGTSLGTRTRMLMFQGVIPDFTIDHNTLIADTTQPGNPPLGLLLLGRNTNVGTFGNPVPYSPNASQQFSSRFTLTNNIMDSGAATQVALSFGISPAALTLDQWLNRTLNANLTINDTTIYGSTPGNTYLPGTFSNVAYGSIGMTLSPGNNVIPQRPSDWNVINTPYAIDSTTTGPVGAWFAPPLTFPLLGAYLINGTIDFVNVANINLVNAAVFSNYPGYFAGGKTMAQQVTAVKALNPSMKIAGYTDIMEIASGGGSAFGTDWAAEVANSWFLWPTYSTRGTWNGSAWVGTAPVGSGFGADYQLNITSPNLSSNTDTIAPNATFRQWQSKRISGTTWPFATNLDGIYFDNFFPGNVGNVLPTGDWLQNGTSHGGADATTSQNWRTAYVDAVTQMRSATLAAGGKNYTIWGNIADWTTAATMTGYTGVLDGGVMEAPLGESFSWENQSGWTAMMNNYKNCMLNLGAFNGFTYPIFSQDLPSSTSWAAHRYGFCSCLLDNAYYFFNTNGATVNVSDEIKFNLGAAIAGPNNPTNGTYANGGLTVWKQGVWRRDFANGIILVNPRGNGAQTVTLETTYWKLRQVIDTDGVNNAAPVTSVTLPDVATAGAGGGGLFLSRTAT